MKNSNQWLIVLLSMIVSIVLWFIVTLNKEYKTVIPYPTAIVEIPQQMQLTKEIPPEVWVEVKGNGIDLLIESWKLRKDRLVFSFDDDYPRGYIRTRNYLGQINQNLPSQLEANYISPDSIRLYYAEKVSKKVKLVSKMEIRLKPAYQLAKPASISPDSIMIYGPQEMLDTIYEWTTIVDRTEPLDKKTTLPLKLDSLDNISTSPNHATLTIEPELYSQTEIKVKINVKGVPEGKELKLSHSKINVKCLVPVSEFKRITESDYVETIPYQDLDPNVPNFRPGMTSLPSSVKVISIEPPNLSYVIVTTAP